MKIIILPFLSLWKCEDGFWLNRATSLNFKEFKIYVAPSAVLVFKVEKDDWIDTAILVNPL